MPDRDFGQQSLEIVLEYCAHYSRGSDEKEKTLPLINILTRYTNEELIAGHLGARNRWMDSILLEPLVPYLAMNIGNQKLTTAWIPDFELNCTMPEGYNLFFLWTTAKWMSGWFRYEFSQEQYVESLKVIVTSGLDVNAPCCRFGPPLHTVVEVCLVLDCRDRHGTPALRQFGALRDADADPLVLFDGMTARDLARKRLHEVEAETYVPVTPQILEKFEKETAIRYLKDMIGYLDSKEDSADGDISEEGATNSHRPSLGYN